MYGLIALFDEKTEQIIKDIWKELKEQSISFYAYEVEDRIPHITLASYNDLNQSFLHNKWMTIMMVHRRLILLLIQLVHFLIREHCSYHLPLQRT